VVGVDEARTVLERLDRIERLEREGAPADELLAELRGLVGEAQAWSRREGDARVRRAVADCEAALLVDQPA
jgi:hypothetical protein